MNPPMVTAGVKGSPRLLALTTSHPAPENNLWPTRSMVAGRSV